MVREKKSLIIVSLCSLSSFLILPAFPAYIMACLYFVNGARRKELRKILVALAMLSVCTCSLVAGLRVVERFSYEGARNWHIPSLAAAIAVYHNDHGALPPRLETLEESGLFGVAPYRLPANGWEVLWETGTRSGPRPHYLPVDSSCREAVVVAVERRTPRTGKTRGYVILGDTRAHFATDEELERILSEDDKVRQDEGISGRWSETAWKYSH